MSRRISWRAAGGASALLACLALLAPAAARASAQPVFALVNGRWWQHGRYVPRTYYTSGGVLRARRPSHVDGTLDLRGLYVLPAPDDALDRPCSVDVARGSLGSTALARPVARVASRVRPRARRLGEGAEASFVALRRDPRGAIDALGDVALRVRRGCVLW